LGGLLAYGSQLLGQPSQATQNKPSGIKDLKLSAYSCGGSRRF